MNRRRQSGLTLPELLVALLVFSLVSAASVAALRLGVDAREQLTRAEARIAEMQIAALVMREDFAQIRPRVVRDEFGEIAGAPFRGGREAQPRVEPRGERRLLAFVRAGWINPEADAPRSTLQYVEYLEKDGALVRRIRPFLDDARGQPRFDRKLISDARDVRFSFLLGVARGDLEWTPDWPLPRASGDPPLAVTLTFTSDRYGEIVERFWIGLPSDAETPR